jgi:diguanylate cyclase (GGDEF)-like protein
MAFLNQKNRFLWLLGLILVAGFLGINLLGFVVARNSVRSGIVDQGLPLTADTVYSEVQRELLRPVFISKQMAQNTFLRDWALAGEKDPGQITRYLANIQEQFKTNTSFYISEKSRKYYQSKGILKVIKESDPRDAWYFRVRTMKAEYELSPDPDLANNNSMTIFINYRLLDAQKRYLGVTGVGITFNTFNTLIHSLEQRFGQRVYFVDKTGKIMLADNNHLELRGNIISLNGISGVARKILNNTNTPERTSYQGSNGVVQVNSRFIPELNWFVLIEQDEARAFAPLQRSFLLNLAIGTLATALVLGLTFLTINQYQKRLEDLATVDTLTQTNTRAIGESLLDQARNESIRGQRAFALVLFDFDNFKIVNDTYGHNSGDIVLKDGLGLVKSTVRAVDSVVRWGGEEFLIILKNTTLEEATAVAEKIRVKIANHVFQLEKETLKVTLSLGVTQLEGEESIAKLVQRADTALYEAKNTGRNRVCSSSAVNVVHSGVVHV